jgi:hypothetical protein
MSARQKAEEHGTTFPCGCEAHPEIIGMQYRFTPEDYDGVSEWQCGKCGQRWGRWTKKILAEGELERRYGGA